MPFTAFRGMHPFAQFIFALFIIVISFLAFFIGSAIIAIPIFGFDAITAISAGGDLTNPGSLSLLKYFQVVQSIGAFIVPPFIIAWLYHGNIASYLYLDKKFSFATALFVVLLVIFANPVINFVGGLNEKLVLPEFLSGLEEKMKAAEEKAAQLTEAFLDVHSFSGLLFNLFMIALLPAIGEELLFRGVIQKIFTQWTKSAHWGIWISAILFSALHLQFYGFVPRLLLGVMFGYLLVWSGSLWVPMVAHFVNNAAAVIGMWLINQGKINQSVEEIGSTPESFYMAIVSVILCFAFLLLLKKQGETRNS